MAGKRHPFALRCPEERTPDPPVAQRPGKARSVFDRGIVRFAPAPSDRADALPERRIREPLQPEDLGLGMPGQDQQGRRAQARRERSEKRRRKRAASRRRGVRGPAPLSATAPDRRSRLEGGPPPESAFEPAPVVRAREIRTPCMDGREQDRLEEVFRLVRTSRQPPCSCQQLEIGVLHASSSTGNAASRKRPERRSWVIATPPVDTGTDASVEPDTSSGAEPDAGNGDGGVPSPEETSPIDDGASGCSVRAPGASEPSGLALIGLVLAAWLRRRRR